MNRRQFIRHPSEISLEIEPEAAGADGARHLKNVSPGGLCFVADGGFEVGTVVSIRVPPVMPAFRTRGRVVWCRPSDGRYEVGIEFLERRDLHRMRLVEQICHIEEYRRELVEVHGRCLTADQAAMEWVRKYAADFPRLEELPADSHEPRAVEPGTAGGGDEAHSSAV